MKAFREMFYFIREYLFPDGCGICAQPLLLGEEAWYGLCNKCRTGMSAEITPDASGAESRGRCDLCGRPLISEIGRCLPCRDLSETEMPAHDKLISLFPYTGKYRKLLEAFKFKKSLGTGHFLAGQLINALKLLPLRENPVLVPVPPRPGKIRKTGWDQIVVLSGLIKQAGKYLDHEIPEIRSCLKRQKSQSQKKLDRKDRKTNLRGRIRVKGKVPKTCILYDDVITTGSTISACSEALKSAGAEKVYGICLFYD